MNRQGRKLFDIAYARSGDKGGNANIGVIAYHKEDYSVIDELLTEESVAEYFRTLGVEKVVKYRLPNIDAFNFVLYGVLGQGGTGLLRIDSQGKALGQALLEMDIYLQN